MAQPQSEVKRDKTAIFNFLIALFAVLAPAAYLLGLSFYQGYMEAFGVDAGIFPLATPDIYVYSYQTVGYVLIDVATAVAKLVKQLFSPPVEWYVLATLVAISILIYAFVRILKNGSDGLIIRLALKIRSKLSPLHWRNNDLTKSLALVSVTAYLALAALLLIVYTSLFWWALPYVASNKGKFVANEQIHAFKHNGCEVNTKTKWNNCFVLLDNKGDVVHEGLLIAKNDKEIAIFKKDGSYIMRLPGDYLLRRLLE